MKGAVIVLSFIYPGGGGGGEKKSSASAATQRSVEANWR